MSRYLARDSTPPVTNGVNGHSTPVNSAAKAAATPNKKATPKARDTEIRRKSGIDDEEDGGIEISLVEDMIHVIDKRPGTKGKVTKLPMLCLFCREALPAAATSSMAVRTEEKEEPSKEEEVTVDTAIQEVPDAKLNDDVAGTESTKG